MTWMFVVLVHSSFFSVHSAKWLLKAGEKLYIELAKKSRSYLPTSIRELGEVFVIGAQDFAHPGQQPRLS